MAATQYTIVAINAEGVETELGHKSKKATAADVARAHRKDTGEAVEVRTGTGNVVFSQAAKKAIKMSPRYTRVVELPEGVAAPDGLRVAYVRPRRGFAVLHDADAAEGEAYALLVLATGELLDDRFATTRDAGSRMKEGVVLPVPADA
jgi:hypothetical protein